AARVLQFLGQVPVVEGGDGLDALVQQFVGEAPVEVEALLDGGAAPGGLDAGPGQGETVGAQAEFGHERDVLAPAVVVVGGDVAGVAVADPAGGAGVGVPDGRCAAVLRGGSLDLVGGRRGTPEEALGEGAGCVRGGRGRLCCGDHVSPFEVVGV